jgi:hypothetical protein
MVGYVSCTLGHVIKFSERPRPMDESSPTPRYQELFGVLIIIYPCDIHHGWLPMTGEYHILTSELWDVMDLPSWYNGDVKILMIIKIPMESVDVSGTSVHLVPEDIFKSGQASMGLSLENPTPEAMFKYVPHLAPATLHEVKVAPDLILQTTVHRLCPNLHLTWLQ